MCTQNPSGCCACVCACGWVGGWGRRYLKVIVREVGNGEGLHECGGVRHRKDEGDLEHVAHHARRVRRAHMPQRQVGEDVIARKVKVRRAVHGDGHVVEAPRRHGVFGAEDTVKIVCVPVVADEAEDGDPQLRARRMRRRPADERLQEQRQREATTEHEIAEGVQALVNLECDYYTEDAHPHDRVFEHPQLIRALLAACWRQEAGQ